MNKIKLCSFDKINQVMRYDVAVLPDGWVFYEDDNGNEIGIGDINVDCIVLQYIGLNDKNNREIYEGNIVKIITNDKKRIYEDIVDVVIWDDINCGFCFSGKKCNYQNFSQYDMQNVSFEVIGNVYQNPELFEWLCYKWLE